jgi:pyrroline-5-carboxylate reductase
VPVNPANKGPVVLVGAGNMGGAMMRGWIARGMEAKDVIVLDPSPNHAMRAFCANNGIRIAEAPPAGVEAGVLFVAVKPQMMAKVLPGLLPLIGEETVAVSVAAGTTNATLQSHLGKIAVVRAMPNTPALVGRGITAAVPSGEVSEKQRERVDGLLKASGPVEWLDEEDLINAVTAVSGSGPAYAFYLTECMAEAGVKAGLPADVAMRLARATVSGAGELMHQAEEDAGTLRKNVTSPNGTTAAALDVLMEKAVAAAKQRAEELAAGD